MWNMTQHKLSRAFTTTNKGRSTKFIYENTTGHVKQKVSQISTYILHTV